MRRALTLVLVLCACSGAYERDDGGTASLDASADAARVPDAAARADATDAGDPSGDAAADPADAGSAPELDACVPFDCGDGTCDGPETCVTCETDCGACPCGDGRCEGRETCASCPGDCGGACPCGDGMCEIARGESCATCAGDCDCACDDFRCGPREWEVCPGLGAHDCGFVDFCGNRICDGVHAEDCANCPWDCCCS